MAVFISLCKGTPEGYKDIKGLPKRWDDLKANVKAAGGRVIGAYAVTGRYDYVLILDLPDVQKGLEVILKALQKGTVTFETLSAVPIDEFVKIVKGL